MTGIAGATSGHARDDGADGADGSMAVMEAALVRVLAGAVTLASDKFVVDAHTRERPEGVYIQGLLEEDGALFLEVASNAFLEVPLTPAAIERLLRLGWQAPEEELPNYWRLVPAAEIVPGALAAQLVRTLVDVYEVGPRDEFTIFPADLAEDALLDAGVEQVGQGGNLGADLVDVLLRLLGAQECGTTAWGRLYRLPGSDEAVLLSPRAARPQLRVEVSDVDPAGFNHTWRLGKLAFEVEVGPAASGAGQSMWVVHGVDFAAISLNLLRDDLGAMRALARQLSSYAERISEAEQEQAALWAELQAIDPDAARLMRLLGDGDDPAEGALNAGLLARPWVGRSLLHVLQEVGCFDLDAETPDSFERDDDLGVGPGVAGGRFHLKPGSARPGVRRELDVHEQFGVPGHDLGVVLHVLLGSTHGLEAGQLLVGKPGHHGIDLRQGENGRTADRGESARTGGEVVAEPMPAGSDGAVLDAVH